MRRILLSLVFIMSLQNSWAIDLGLAREDGGAPGAFLDFAASARSLGMGRAHVAVSDDAGASYWNSAGLGQVDQKDIVSLYSIMEENSGYGFFSYAHPTAKFGTLGLAGVSLTSDEFDKRSENATPLGKTELNEGALLLSYGKRISRKIFIGSTIKGVRQKIDSYSDTGMGWDMGFLYHFGKTWSVGLSLRNLLQPELELRNKKETFHRGVRSGFKWEPLPKLIFALDVDQLENQTTKFNFGSEWTIKEAISLRGGLDDTELTAGLGLHLGDWTIDYAIGYNNSVTDVDNLGSSHRFGFHVNFGSNMRILQEKYLSRKWKKKGSLVLKELRMRMRKKSRWARWDTYMLIEKAQFAIENNGYPNPKELFETKGYVHFYRREYESAVYSFGEALLLKPNDKDISVYLQKAVSEMNQEKKREVIESQLIQIKDHFKNNSYQEIKDASEKILMLDPGNEQAKIHLEYAKRKIEVPMERALDLAKEKYDEEDYLEAVRYLNKVQRLNPEHVEAQKIMDSAIQALENQHRKSLATRRVKELQVDALRSQMLYSRGLQMYSQGNLNGALMAWQQALEHDGNNKTAKNAYKRVLIELRERLQKR